MAVDTLGPALDRILECVVEGLTVPVARAFVQDGTQVAYDDCCEGQVWVRVVTMAAVYPNGVAAGSCPPLYMRATVGVGIQRCSPSVDDRGVAPKPEAITEAAHAMTRDMADLYSALVCCMDKPRLALGSWTPDGPQGGCAGGEWTVSVKVDACGC